MVDRLTPTGRVPTVNTPTPVRQTRRERQRQNRRDTPSEEQPQRQSSHGSETSAPEEDASSRTEDRPATGKRINVVI